MVCVGDFVAMKTLCDAYHKEFESHKCSTLDTSALRVSCMHFLGVLSGSLDCLYPVLCD